MSIIGSGKFSGTGKFAYVVFPTAPTNLSASSVTSTSAVIGFTPPPTSANVTSYNAYNNGVLLGSYTGTNSITLTGLTATTTYVITLGAVNSVGVSPVSASVSFTTTPTYFLRSGYTDYYKFDIADLNGPQATNVSLFNYGTNSYRGNLNSYSSNVNGGASISATTFYKGTGSLRLPNTTTTGAYTFALANGGVSTSTYSFCCWINFAGNFTGGGNFDVLFALKDTATIAQYWPSNANEIAYLSGGTRSFGVSARNNAGTDLYSGNFNYSFSTNYGTWYHIGFTYSGGTHIMYVNGVAVSTRTGWNNNNFTATYATIGGIYSLPAYIDEFILYNTTLSDTDMSNNYNYYLH